MSNSSFAVDTAKIWKGILLAVLAGIVAAILQPIADLGNTIQSVSAFVGGDMGGLFSGGLSTLDIVIIIFDLAVIFGYVLVFLGISGFQSKLTGKDAKNANLLKWAYILIAGGIFLGILGLPVLPWLCEAAAFVLTTLGYFGLKAGGFNEPIKKAFNLLFISQIIYLAAIVIDLIPFTGFLVSVAEIVAFILILVGWNKVKSNS